MATGVFHEKRSKRSRPAWRNFETAIGTETSGLLITLGLVQAEVVRVHQTEGMVTSASSPIDQRLAVMAAQIRQLIPAAEVRLFGSRARGQARPDSDVDLLITAPDAWLAQRDRFTLLGDLWGAVAQPDLSVDLVLHSCSEANRRAQEPGSLVQEAFAQGVLLDGQP